MNPGVVHLKIQALKGAEHRLHQAATFARLNIKNPLFQKRLGSGATAVLVRLEWPGVLSVVDPATGELLAISIPGKPDALSLSFVPPIPALDGAASAGSLQGGGR